MTVVIRLADGTGLRGDCEDANAGSIAVHRELQGIPLTDKIPCPASSEVLWNLGRN